MDDVFDKNWNVSIDINSCIVCKKKINPPPWEFTTCSKECDKVLGKNLEKINKNLKEDEKMEKELKNKINKVPKKIKEKIEKNDLDLTYDVETKKYNIFIDTPFIFDNIDSMEKFVNVFDKVGIDFLNTLKNTEVQEQKSFLDCYKKKNE